MGKDQFGSSDKSRRIRPDQVRRAKKKGCCSYSEAAKAITRLEFRLAIRFVRMDIKARLGLLG